MIDRAHAVAVEELRGEARHRQAVLEHVGDPRGRPAVVLEHSPGAVSVADEVAARDVAVDPAGWADAVHGAAKLRRAEDELPGHDPLADDLAPVVDVVDEGVECTQPLRQPSLDRVPLRRRDDPRHQVERKRAVLGVGAIRIDDRERDPLLAEDLVAAAAEVHQREAAHPVERRDEVGGMLARRPGRGEELVGKARGRCVLARVADQP